MSTARRVVVTGLGLVSPFGAGSDANFAGLMGPGDCSATVSGFDHLGLRGRSACQAPIQASTPDPSLPPRWQDRITTLLDIALSQALRQATGEDRIPPGCGMVLGTTLGGMNSGMAFHRGFLAGTSGRVRHLLDYLALSQPASLLTRRGESLRPRVISNACASGSSAIGIAFRSVRYGLGDVVLAGGADPMSPFTFWGFNALRLVSQDRCRPFDAQRDGLLLGEGAAMFVLEEREHARARGAPILGEVLGYGESNDSYHPTQPHPQGEGAVRAMTEALTEARLPAGELGYINAHGTGTPANDRAEATALATLLGKDRSKVPVSSTKGHVGHCLGAAGALEAAYTWICLGRNRFPATANLTTPDAQIDLWLLRDRPEPREVFAALSNSFGFGGMNASLVLARGEVAP